MNISGFDYENINNPFDNFMEREGGLLGSPGMVDLGGTEAGVKEIVEETIKDTEETTKEIQGGDLENLWISTWIKSRSFLPGKRGFLIDGKSGFIECANLKVRGIGEIGGWNIDATRIYSDDDDIVLDSENKRIEIGSDDAIVLDGVNKRITVGTSNEIIIDGANKKIESGNYVSDYAGSGFHIDENLAEFGNIACRGLIRTSVFQKDVISTVGGNLMVLDGDVLDEDMDATDAETLTTKATTTFSVGDILRIKDGTSDEWLEVTAVNGAVYTVNRDKKGDYGADANPAWKKGATVVNYRQSGDGGIYQTASEANAPYLSVFTHAGSPWTDLTTRLRIGNLNGYLGYSSDLYGIGIGDTTHYLKYDPTNHLRISGDITGSTITGGTIKTAASGARVQLDNTNYLQAHDSSYMRAKLDTDSLYFYDETSGTQRCRIRGTSNAFAYPGTSIETDYLIVYASTPQLLLGNVTGYGGLTMDASANLQLNASSVTMKIDVYGGLVPQNTNSYDLGSNSYRWDTLHTREICLSGSCRTSWPSGSSGANTALSNLSSVAINTSLLPATDGTLDLGSPAKGWADLYLEANQKIFFGSTYLFSNGSLFSVSGHFCPDTTNSYDLGTSSYKWRHIYVDQNIYLDSNQYIYWNSTKYIQWNSSGNFYVNDEWLPSASNSYDLGSTGRKWRQLHLDQDIHLDSNQGIWWGGSYYLKHDGTQFVINDDLQPSTNNSKRLGYTDKKWHTIHRVNEQGCHLPTSNCALDTIRKLKKPKIEKGKDFHYGNRHYFKTEDFPDEMKIVDEGSKRADKKEIELTRVQGVTLNAVRELVEKFDDIDSRLKELEKIK